MKDFGEFDYIVVGGGAAGCVLANRLSADPDVSVLLLEGGNDERWIWTKIPVGYLYCINNPRTDWCYKTEPEPGLNGRSIIYARGKGLGGSTLINAMLYLRGQTRDYNEWAELTGDAGWSWESVLPHFKGVEDHWKGNSAAHGAGGEWRVERQRLSWDVLDRFAEATVQAGIPATPDFNGGDNLGVSQFEVNQKRGTRWSSARGFLDPVRHRPNLRVVTGALADKLAIAGRAVKGIEFRLGGESCVARSRIETVLAAGSIGSPAILQRSGVGDPQLLSSLGIPVVHALQGVGQNLQDHLQIRSVYKIQGIKTLNQQANSLWGKAMMGLEYALFRRGPLTMAPSQLGLFARSDESVASPDLEYHVQPLSLDKFGDPVHKFPAFTASVCDLRPKSRGSIDIRDRDPASAPKIAPCYLSHEDDRRKAATALRLTRRIVNQPALAPFKPVEHLPGKDFTTDEQLAQAAGNIGTTIFHPVGTCKMGRPDDHSAVTDSELRVRDMSGLRIVDASIMPTITSGNTSSPTIMIAERGAQLIRAARRSQAL
ncbi:MAG TPA: GMC family oxidoreductase N-terminal domain-containing protein [Rhodocyclaceae bacterium]|jgi:choline dehydrogenase|uniref:GMC family oxidoreductase n=1 Tax=Accumulibacter sp. TaxID=2053492 RepID=UPI002BA54DF0|nr:GMC family oxidoreductase N-terminal domain-containing protein [Accumulibacter sp.]HMW56929.1 GMC family oxidoreductase N-terminal domain-containing protein [Accumulibacter sp.]HMZ55367.1 GMC family oxidoreductase N-terminal domain-containing protein [Nitrospira sp.]HNM81853.1 GMC family oxidoreductase N-terminal domain-containing protein [Rhodocyclaceae bacterium]HNO35080.1 GMC family oxidoreductase N-terminal domain-containing protein [Nitrospira sp.]